MIEGFVCHRIHLGEEQLSGLEAVRPGTSPHVTLCCYPHVSCGCTNCFLLLLFVPTWEKVTQTIALVICWCYYCLDILLVQACVELGNGLMLWMYC